MNDWNEREKARLAIELDFYATHKNEWLQQHEGEWVVAQDQNLLGFFPSFELAFREGVMKFGVHRSFLVKQVLRREPIYFVGEITQTRRAAEAARATHSTNRCLGD